MGCVWLPGGHFLFDRWGGGFLFVFFVVTVFAVAAAVFAGGAVDDDALGFVVD